MRRNRLRIKRFDSKTDTDRITYNKQRDDYCVSLIRKEKKIPIAIILK